MDAKSIYQKYLKEDFDRRRNRRSGYSLRAYARDLGVPSPKLSQYLNGECGISGKRAGFLATKLNLGPVEAELFICSAEAAHARDPRTRERNLERLKYLLSSTFSEVNIEKFNLIRDWYHVAILELTELESFESNCAWISKSLNIPEDAASQAIKRLAELGFLDISGQRWVQTHRDFETPPEFSSRAVREYHHQILQLVDSRFEEVAVEKRELGSVVFGVDAELIPDLKQLVRRFQKETAALVERSRKKDSLYTLNFQLMPLLEESR